MLCGCETSKWCCSYNLCSLKGYNIKHPQDNRTWSDHNKYKISVLVRSWHFQLYQILHTAQPPHYPKSTYVSHTHLVCAAFTHNQ